MTLSRAGLRQAENKKSSSFVAHGLQKSPALSLHSALPITPTPAPKVQAKLEVSEPGDEHEQEADRIAEQVMRMPEPAASRLPPSDGDEKPISPPLILRKCASCEEEDQISRKAETSFDAVHESASIPTSGGAPLPASERAFFEPRFGYDFRKVRVHQDTQANQSAKALNAAAYTIRNQIVFGAGRYQPNTYEGRRLLAHELTHVIQQENSPSVMTARATPARTFSNQETIERLEFALSRASAAIRNRSLPSTQRALIARLEGRLRPILAQLRDPNQEARLNFDATPSQNEIHPGDSQRSIDELYRDYTASRSVASAEQPGEVVQAKALPSGLQITPAFRSQIQRFCIICIPIVFLGGLLLSGCSRRCRRSSGNATPNTGINISWNGNQINIRARVQFSGPNASQPVAEAMKRDIERMWNATFSDGYASTCQVDMILGGPTDSTRAQILVGMGTSVTESSVMGSTMYFVYTGSPSDLVWSPAHEFAHLVGLRDRRSSHLFRPETSESGYERNLMGAIPGGDINRRGELVLERRNIEDWLNQYAMGPCP